MSDGLDQLAEQAKAATRRIHQTMDAERIIDLFATEDIIREALEAATQALREQLEQATVDNQRVMRALAERDQQLAQMTQERDAAICRATMAEDARDLWHERFSETLHQWSAQREELDQWRARACALEDLFKEQAGNSGSTTSESVKETR